MNIKSVRVVNVRNHSDTIVNLAPGVSLITGRNGSGKTSILEAIYISLRGSSFKDNDNNIINNLKNWYRIEIESNGLNRVVTFDKSKHQKQFMVDGKVNYVLLAKYKQPVVLFQPDDTRLISGSPARRRKYLDQTIAQFDIQYLRTLKSYEKSLAQRNKILKQTNPTKEQVFAWDVMLSNLGADIIAKRKDYLSLINQYINDYYKMISHDESEILFNYNHGGEDTSQSILNRLESNFYKDCLIGSTTTGPHRHDFTVTINNKEASVTASRGETRTIVLALKYIEADNLSKLTNKLPVILLDDVFGELDESRQRQLLEILVKNQIIITATKPIGKIQKNILNIKL